MFNWIQFTSLLTFCWYSSQWRHNKRHVVSNHRHHDCLLKCLLRCTSKKTSKLPATGLCDGNPPVTRKMFSFDDVIIIPNLYADKTSCFWCRIFMWRWSTPALFNDTSTHIETRFWYNLCWISAITHWGRDKIPSVLQRTFWIHSSWKIVEIWLKFRWNISPFVFT